MEGTSNKNLATYRGAFKGSVIKEFTTPKPFKIMTVRPGSMISEYGYGDKMSHPTPTNPHGRSRS